MELKNTFILTDYLVGSPGWETDEAHPLLEVGLAVELQQRDVVVQRLAVVVVVDVGRGHPQGLRQSEVSIEISWTNQRSVLRLAGPIRGQY